MSDFRAIAAVTATLQRVLQAAVQKDISGAQVSTVRPAEGQNTHLPVTGVNIFLYQVSLNPGWRNADLPTRRPDGELAQRPQVALDLNYLFSFYGDELTLEPQRLLGSTVAFLHSQPLLSRAQIEAAIAAAIAEDPDSFLGDSDLADQIDLVRFVPLSLSLEELSRVWSIFLQVHYVLSLAYRASVVLIEPQVTPRPALPARAYNLAAIPLRQPYIRRIVAQAGEGTPITPGTTICIEGLSLLEAVTRVEIDGAEVSTIDVRPERIRLTLPSALSAGPHGVQVRQGIAIGAPDVAHLAFTSNLGMFTVQPIITKTGNKYDITVKGVQGTGSALRSATVEIKTDPDVAPGQTATLELLTAQGVAYTFMSQPRAADTDQLTFLVGNVKAGDYLFRVRVDGAESPLDLDAHRVPVAPKETIS